MKKLVIGDIHCKTAEYKAIINRYVDEYKIDDSVQLGDYGFAAEHEWHLQYIDWHRHKVLFGNHDDYTFLDKPHSLGNWHVEDNKMMFIRGAFSIDRRHRIEGRNWWQEEEMSAAQFNDCFDIYCKVRPEIVISHDCPDSVRRKLFGIYDKTATSFALQMMLNEHRPKLWVFGHHHQSRTEVIGLTTFVCLDELEPFIIEY